MKIKVNTEIIKKLNPCKDRLDNYLNHYANFSGSIEDFLYLENISHEDKLWVSLRLIPRVVLEEFAIDCAIHAYAADDAYAAYAAATYATADYAAYVVAHTSADSAAYAAANAAAYAADAYAYTTNAEQCRQIEALIWLIQDHKE